jgi:hypothetical protein
MPPSLVDYKTPEEQAVYDFYKEHPGATWVEMMEALHMEEKEAWAVSNRLRCYGELTTDFKWNEVSRFWIHELEEAPNDLQLQFVTAVTPYMHRKMLGDI